ncbi:MAG: trypsin-like serine protease, partial [Pseudomonadota bacterium]
MHLILATTIALIGFFGLSACQTPPADPVYSFALEEADILETQTGYSWADEVGQIEKVGNGWTSDGFYWPAIISFKNCSGVLIGERVLLTAAHCVDAHSQDLTRSVNLNWFGMDIPATCEMSEVYAAYPPTNGQKSRGPEDYAL